MYKKIITFIILCSSLNVYSACNTNLIEDTLNTYSIGINQFNTLDSNSIKKIQYEKSFEKKFAKNTFGEAVTYCYASNRSFELNNKVFGVVAYVFNNQDDLTKAFTQASKQKGLSDKKILTSYELQKKGNILFFYYGNYMNISSINSVVNGTY